MAQPAMQQNNRRTCSEDGVPDLCSLVLEISFTEGNRQWLSTIRFKHLQVVVTESHSITIHMLLKRTSVID
jgi:hypothetical protein